jgi:hypothetical protein
MRLTSPAADTMGTRCTLGAASTRISNTCRGHTATRGNTDTHGRPPRGRRNSKRGTAHQPCDAHTWGWRGVSPRQRRARPYPPVGGAAPIHAPRPTHRCDATRSAAAWAWEQGAEPARAAGLTPRAWRTPHLAHRLRLLYRHERVCHRHVVRIQYGGGHKPGGGLQGGHRVGKRFRGRRRVVRSGVQVHCTVQIGQGTSTHTPAAHVTSHAAHKKGGDGKRHSVWRRVGAVWANGRAKRNAPRWRV